MEKYEYEDDTIPRHVANFLRQQAEEKAIKVLERAERPHIDDDEARQHEAGQVFTWINLLR